MLLYARQTDPPLQVVLVLGQVATSLLTLTQRVFVFILADMPNITVSRHCMQDLLHAAQSFGPEKCCGLMAGRRNMIEIIVPVTDFFQGERYRNTLEQLKFSDSGWGFVGVYASAPSVDSVDAERLKQLVKMAESSGGLSDALCLIVETGHAGRMDALLFADPELSQPLTLEMLEEGICTRAA